MSEASTLTTVRVFAVVFAVTLWGFPVSRASAAEQSCPIPTCPIEARELRHAQHEAEEARARAQKAAEHAQHEAEEARAREQREVEHQQHEAAEAYARQLKAYSHALHEAQEAQEHAAAKFAKANALYPR